VCVWLLSSDWRIIRVLERIFKLSSLTPFVFRHYFLYDPPLSLDRQTDSQKKKKLKSKRITKK
jgi:hypothetical protein